MDDEIQHRYKKDTTFRDIAVTAAIGILILAAVEYFDPDETTKYLTIGFIAGASIGFLVGYLSRRKEN